VAEDEQLLSLKRKVRRLERRVASLEAGRPPAEVGELVESEAGVKLLKNPTPKVKFRVIDREGKEHDYNSPSAAENAFDYYTKGGVPSESPKPFD